MREVVEARSCASPDGNGPMLSIGTLVEPIISRPMGLLGQLHKKIGSRDPVTISPLGQASRLNFSCPRL